MQKFYPYQVLQFDLSTIDHDFVFPEDDKGLYGVVWFNTIPLGDFYFGADKRSVTTFYGASHAAIKETLQHYANQFNLEVDTHKVTDFNSVKQLAQKVYDRQLNNIEDVVPISLVICTRNRAASLNRCLSSLMKLPCKPKEIIVVDNASNNSDTKFVADNYVSVKYIYEPRPGLDIARNTGALAATENIIAYTDDDTEIHMNWLHQVYQSFQNINIHAMTGLVLTAALDTEAQWIFERHWPFNRGFADRIFDHAFFKSNLYHGPPVWEVGAGANMAFRKQALEAVNYFDERLDVGAAGCSGDSEIWYRLLANGYTIHYNPRAVVSHFHRNEMRKLKRQIFFYMRGFATAILIQYHDFKHRGNLRHLFKKLPPYYLELLVKGFPRYHDRHATVLVEIRGILSGIIYYLRNRKKKRNYLTKV